MNTDTPINFTEHITDAHENETHLQRVKSNVRSQETSNVNVAYMDVACINLTKDEHHCNMCERTYQHKSSLDGHIKKIHEKEHHCNSYDRVHNHKNNLTGHIEDVHEDQGGAQIEHCNATDTEKPNLQEHGRAVHENKNANCVDVTCADLATNEHHCGMCEKTYKYKKGLTRHIKSVHEDKGGVQIENCNATDTEKPYLRGHGKAVH